MSPLTRCAYDNVVTENIWWKGVLAKTARKNLYIKLYIGLNTAQNKVNLYVVKQ